MHDAFFIKPMGSPICPLREGNTRSSYFVYAHNGAGGVWDYSTLGYKV